MTASILIIAREPIWRGQIASALTEGGFIVFEAPGMPEVDEITEVNPDVAIVDDVLLSEDGKDVCFELHHIFNIPVILLGEDSSDEIWVKALVEAGADFYLIKPVSHQELVARVKAILRRTKPSGESMSGEREVDRGDSLLTNEERTNGFSIVVDGQHNTTLLKGGKPVAWFSAAVTAEVLRGFIELVKHCEESG